MAERIVMLKEIMPGLRRLGLLRNPDNPGGLVPTQAMAETARGGHRRHRVRGPAGRGRRAGV